MGHLIQAANDRSRKWHCDTRSGDLHCRRDPPTAFESFKPRVLICRSPMMHFALTENSYMGLGLLSEDFIFHTLKG